MTSDWQPCEQCMRRLRSLERARQMHTDSLEVVAGGETKHSPPLDKDWWSRKTDYQCTDCGLGWLRFETQRGALKQYESEFSPHPTRDREAAVSAVMLR
jgi:hypothetical protein